MQKDTQKNNKYHGESARLWKPENMGGFSLFKARFKRFEFKRHTHDSFAVGVIENGAQTFYHKGRECVAPQGSMITVNPGEVHDGRSLNPEGYQYRMAYVRPDILATIFKGYGDTENGFGFLQPVTYDKHLAKRLFTALNLIDQGQGMEYQSLFIQALSDIFVKHAGPIPGVVTRAAKDHALIESACRFINDHLDTQVTLVEIASAVGLSQYHFLRVFKKTMGLPPHAYIIHQRIKRAKHAMENGASILEAAHESGFSDQSHLTRNFKSYYGLTPGQFKKDLTS